MGNMIHTIPLGFDNTYVVKDNGAIMIDGGDPKKGKAFLKSLEEIGIKPEEIQLIILTHGHWDHIGSAAEIKEMTGAKVVMHKNEKHWLQESLKPMPPGVSTWGKISTKLFSWTIVPFVHIRPTEVDIVLEDDEFSLEEYGISGKIIYTPGHSSGSVSVLLESGEAFVGDLAMNKFPLRLSPGLPIYAEDWPKLLDSWQMLLNQGAKMIYPSHGKAFSAEIISAALSKEAKK
ncbi:MAG: MBL fold metallo-hydrolase [Desulfobacteraceae bacterium]|jgi:glyoxylase-like metal-dependent hydrolase (beta-lactamase superfamily II)